MFAGVPASGNLPLSRCVRSSNISASSLEYSVASIQETGDPWGIPLMTGSRSSQMPSRQTATCHSSRKEAVH
ncbi:hypothetical protein K439DRAFT_1327427 [Ramaria rubella]|nr:hypothetical protein K439DRAFT_1327427 [Ramaria rubella]